MVSLTLLCKPHDLITFKDAVPKYPASESLTVSAMDLIKKKKISLEYIAKLCMKIPSAPSSGRRKLGNPDLGLQSEEMHIQDINSQKLHFPDLINTPLHVFKTMVLADNGPYRELF